MAVVWAPAAVPCCPLPFISPWSTCHCSGNQPQIGGESAQGPRFQLDKHHNSGNLLPSAGSWCSASPASTRSATQRVWQASRSCLPVQAGRWGWIWEPTGAIITERSRKGEIKSRRWPQHSSANRGCFLLPLFGFSLRLHSDTVAALMQLVLADLSAKKHPENVKCVITDKST